MIRRRRYRRRRLRESLYYRFKLYCCCVARDPARLRTQYSPVRPKTHTTVAATTHFGLRNGKRAKVHGATSCRCQIRRSDQVWSAKTDTTAQCTPYNIIIITIIITINHNNIK